MAVPTGLGELKTDKNYVLFDCVDLENNYDKNMWKCLKYITGVILALVGCESKFIPKEVEAQLQPLWCCLTCIKKEI